VAARPTDPEALHLFQLIGAPLLALVQAEAQAAQVSAEFIKRVGFAQSASEPADGPGTAFGKPLQHGGELGELRVAEFGIERRGPDGTSEPHVVRVPVLSLFPIPLLQVKEAKVDFDVRVVSRVPLADADRDRKDPTLSTDFLAPERVELKGHLEPGGNSRGGRSTGSAHVRVQVSMAQSDLPAGLIHLMKTMSESIHAVPRSLVEQERARRTLTEGEG
jgi:hypothetical protein